jgi:hypothetical protein
VIRPGYSQLLPTQRGATASANPRLVQYLVRETARICVALPKPRVPVDPAQDDPSDGGRRVARRSRPTSAPPPPTLRRLSSLARQLALRGTSPPLRAPARTAPKTPAAMLQAFGGAEAGRNDRQHGSTERNRERHPIKIPDVVQLPGLLVAGRDPQKPWRNADTRRARRTD